MAPNAAALSGTAITTTAVIAMTTLQKTIIAAKVAVLSGAGIYEARQAAQLHNQVQTLHRQQAPLGGQVEQLTHGRDGLRNS